MKCLKNFFWVLILIFSHFSFSNQKIYSSTILSAIDEELLFVAKKGAFEWVKKAVNKGAYVNTRDPVSGKTALHYLAALGEKKAVIFLLDHGADLHIKDAFGERPIRYAKNYKFSFVASYNKIGCEQFLKFCRKNEVKNESILGEKRDRCKELLRLSYCGEDLVSVFSKRAEIIFRERESNPPP